MVACRYATAAMWVRLPPDALFDRGVLLGEERGSNPREEGSNPSISAVWSRGSSGEGVRLTSGLRMVRFHPGSLRSAGVARRHASLVLRRSGFDPRADLCSTPWW